MDRASGVLLVVLLLAAFGLAGQRIWAIASGPPPPGPGMAAPEAQGTSSRGDPLSLRQHQGQVVLVDFWGTWCPPCVASMPTLNGLHQHYQDKGFVVLGVNQDPGDAAGVNAFLEAKHITFASIMDSGDIARSWGVYTFPTSFLVGRDGVIRQTYRGLSSEARLKRDIEAALAVSQ